MKKILNAGIVGFGMIGKTHSFGYATLPYFAPDLPVVGRVLGVATSRAETAERAKATSGAAFATTDFREITENPEIDVVHICTPNAEHLPALLSAIRAGKHVYCEKPIVSNAAEAELVRAALRENEYRGISQTAFHLRGFTAIRRAKELIDAGKLGKIVQYRAGYFHSGALSATAPFRWKHDEKGGSILDLASHLLDLVDFLIGLPAELTAQATTFWPTRPVRAVAEGETLADVPTRPVLAEDGVSILTRGLAPAGKNSANAAANGDPNDPAALTGVVEATKLANGAEDEMRLEIGGTKGAIRFSLMNPHYLEFFDATKPTAPNGGESGWLQIAAGGRYGAPESEFPSPKSTTGWARAHVASLATFYRSIAEGKALGPDLEQGLRIQDALDVVKKSVRERSWERV